MASLWQSIKNFFRGKRDEAAAKLADPVRDAGFAIEDSERVYEDFENSVASLMAQNGRNKSSAAKARADETKWNNISVAAAKAGNREDCEAALKNKNEASLKVKRFEDEIKRNDETIAKLRKQLEEVKSKISAAKSNKDALEARLKGAQIREELLKSASGLSGSGPLAALDDLEKKTNEVESMADAREELAGASQDSLADKYDSGDAELQSEVDRMMSEHKK